MLNRLSREGKEERERKETPAPIGRDKEWEQFMEGGKDEEVRRRRKRREKERSIRKSRRKTKRTKQRTMRKKGNLC